MLVASQTIDPGQFRCKLDPKVTPETVMEFRSEIGELWGGACGRNRGIFVLDPPDGKTYGEAGCSKLSMSAYDQY